MRCRFRICDDVDSSGIFLSNAFLDYKHDARGFIWTLPTHFYFYSELRVSVTHGNIKFIMKKAVREMRGLKCHVWLTRIQLVSKIWGNEPINVCVCVLFSFVFVKNKNFLGIHSLTISRKQSKVGPFFSLKCMRRNFFLENSPWMFVAFASRPRSEVKVFT